MAGAKRYRQVRRRMLVNDKWMGVATSSYDSPTSIVESYSLYQWGMGDFTYADNWAEDYADGSEYDTTGLVLMKRAKTKNRTITLYRAGAMDTPNILVSIDERRNDKRAWFEMMGHDEERMAELREQLVSKIIKPQADETKLAIGFWHQTGNGPDRDVRDIAAKPWDNIHDNYSEQVQSTLQKLSEVKPDTIDGRILLFYGPAGTGKTTFLRSLADAWRKWATMEYIIDPEVFLNDAGYITEVILREESEDILRNNLKLDDEDEIDEDDEPWRLIVLEDAGELLQKDAKSKTGQGLSRLLNVTDGILGEGRKILVAITTNEDVASLHPAIIRPGRCMVNAEVGPLPADEAAQWLGESVDGAKTIAELYHMKNGLGDRALTTVEDKPAPNTGQYL